MAAQKITDTTAEMLKAKAQQKLLVVGRAEVKKGLQQGRLQKVFLAGNCPLQIQEELSHYAALAAVPLEKLAQNNEELGILCKKNFLVAVIGLKL